MNRHDLQQLAEIRLADARTLLVSGQFSGAYYLAGYAVECAIKACIAKLVREFDFPDKPLAEKAWKHNLSELINVAQLNIELQTSQVSDPAFADNWKIAVNWNENSRYTLWDEARAASLIEAVQHQQSGVLTWLRQYW